MRGARLRLVPERRVRGPYLAALAAIQCDISLVHEKPRRLTGLHSRMVRWLIRHHEILVVELQLRVITGKIAQQTRDDAPVGS